MRTITINVYQYNELSEKAMRKAIEDNYYINVMDSWWEAVYEDADQVGIEIREFDIDRGDYCIALIPNTLGAATEILKNHGEECETYKLANAYIKDLTAIEKKAIAAFKKEYGENFENAGALSEDEIPSIDDYTDENYDADMEEVTETFIKAMERQYLKMLREEYEYLTSEEAIVDTLKANNYEFTANGKIYRNL